MKSVSYLLVIGVYLCRAADDKYEERHHSGNVVVVNEKESSKPLDDKEEVFHDGHSWKTSKVERYETETVDNPNSDWPGNRYIVKNKYQVREQKPFEDATVGYDHVYEYPVAEVDNRYNKNSLELDNYVEPQEKEKKDDQKRAKSKPKVYSYSYQWPPADGAFYDNVKEVNTYVRGSKEGPSGEDSEERNKVESEESNEEEAEEPKKKKKGDHQVANSKQNVQKEPEKNVEYVYSVVDYDYSPTFEHYSDSAPALDTDHHSPSAEYTYNEYKSGDPSFYDLGAYGDYR